MSNATVAGKKAAVAIRDGSTSMAELEQSASKSTLALYGTRIATIALQTALSFGLSLAIQTAISLFQDLIHYQEKQAEAAKEQAEKSREVANKAKEESNSIVDLIKKYKELKASSNLDGEKRAEIRDIQSKISELVGDEADNLDLVNGKLDTEIAKMQKLASIKADEHIKDYEDAVINSGKAVEKELGNFIEMPRLNYSGVDDREVIENIKKIAEQYHAVWVDYENPPDLAFNGGNFGEYYEGLNKIIEYYQDNVENRNDSPYYQTFVNKKKELDELIKSTQDDALTLLNGLTLANGYELQSVKSLDEYKQLRQKIIDDLLENDAISEETEKGIIDEDWITSQVDNYLSNVEKFSSYYGQWEAEKYKKDIEDVVSEVKKQLASDDNADIVNSWFDSLTDDQKDIIVKVKAKYDTSDWNLDDWKSIVENWKIPEDEKISFNDLIADDDFQGNFIHYQETISTLSDALKDLREGGLSSSEENKLFKKFPELSTQIGNLDEALLSLIEDTEADSLEYFNKQLDYMATEGDKTGLTKLWNNLLKISDSAKKTSSVAANIEKLNDVLDDLQSTYSDIQDIQENFNENGYYSTDDLQKLLELEPEYLNLLIDENGQINLNNAAYKEYVATKAKALLVDELKDLYSTVLNMKVEEAQAYANAEAYNAETRSVKDLLAATTELYLVQAKQKDSANNTTAYTDAIKRSFSTAANYAALVDSYINSLSTSQNEFSTATEQATSALEAQKDALEDEKDALQDAKEAWEDYRDSLSDAQSDIQDLIDLVIEYIKQLKNDEMDALSDQIDALETQKDNYADIIAQKKEALELAKKEREEADKLADLQKAVAKDALALAVANLDDSSAGKKAQKQAHDNLLESNKNLQDELAEQEYDMRIAALEKDQEEYETHIDKRIEKLNKEKDAIQEYLNNVRQLYEDACNMIDNDTGDLYGKLWNDYVYPYTTKTRAEFDNLWSKAQEAIQRYIGDNGTLIGVMEYLQGEIYVTDGKIEDLEGEIGRLESAIDITSRAIDDTATSINNVSSSIGGLGASISEYMDLLNQVANQKKHHFNWNGEHYISYADNQSEALADIAGQIKARTGQDVAVYGPLAYYKKGTYGSKGGWNITQEGGISEDVFQKLRGGKFTYMTPDSHVFKGDATENLHEFADSPKEYISRVMGQINYRDFMSSRAKESISRMERAITNIDNGTMGDTTISAPITIHVAGDATQTTVKAIENATKKIEDKVIAKISNFARSNRKDFR